MAVENALTSCVRGADGCWGSEGGSTPTPSACPSPCPSPSSHQPSTSHNTYDDVTLVQLLHERRWSSALNLFRERNAVRILRKVDLSEDDVSSLLHIYCKALLAKSPGKLHIDIILFIFFNFIHVPQCINNCFVSRRNNDYSPHCISDRRLGLFIRKSLQSLHSFESATYR